MNGRRNRSGCQRLVETPKLAFGWMVGCAAVFLFAGVLSFTDILEGLNETAATAFEGFRAPALTSIFTAISVAGNWPIYVVGSAALLATRRVRDAVGWQAAGSVVVAAILNPVLKNAFQVPRPEGEHLVKASGWGFPSGHAMSAAAFFLVAAIGLMVVVKSRLARAAIAAGAAVCVILIGISRIYLGVHSLVDVIAGWGAGLAVGFATIAAAQLLRSWALRQLKPH